MTTAPSSTFTVRRPAGGLARYVSQYWLSHHNTSPVYSALPDGCVDLVLEVTATGHRSWIYGSTTMPTAIPCTRGTHYLGVRFHPGRSRHFITAAANEITDGREELRALMQFPTEQVAARISSEAPPQTISAYIAHETTCIETSALLAREALFDHLDQILISMLSRVPPVDSYVDGIIPHIDTHHGIVRVEDIAARFGKSRRQLERVFLQTVGMPLKLFCMISRLKHAADLIIQPTPRSLTTVAHDAGYSDQAHMTRNFTRLAGISPGQLRVHDAFFQYHSPR